MLDTSLLRDKTVAVTGASGGIGRATAELLLRYGANVMLGSRTDRGLDGLVRQSEGRACFHALDVTSEESVRRFYEAAAERFSRIDALVNCAGTGVFGSLLSSETEDFDRMLATNLRGPYLCCKVFGRHMVDRGSGTIINVISVAGQEAIPGCGGYVASKFGLLGLTRVLRAELRQCGVQVMAVLPGAVDTPFWDSVGGKPDASAMIPPAAVAAHLVFLLCQPEGAVVEEMTVMPPKGILPLEQEDGR